MTDALTQADRLAGRRELGKRSEDIGASWLASRGMRIIERNYRCPLGEIDLVGMLDDTLVIVEIRSRTSDRCGAPAESITYRKKQRLRRLASYYLCQKGMINWPCRFYVLGVLCGGDESGPQIEWFPNAF